MSQDLGNQLNLASQLKAALNDVIAAYEKLGASAGAQTDAVRDLAKDMQKMVDKSPDKDIDSMTSALENLGGRLDKTGPQFSKFAKVATVGLASATAGVRGFQQGLGATMNVVGGLTSSIMNLAKGGIGALVGSYKAVIGLAQDVAAQMDVVAQASENLRGQFGDLASNEGQAVSGAIGNLRSEFGKTSGLSLGRVFGPGPEGMAAAMAAMGEMAGELGAKLNTLMDDVKQNAAAMMTLNRGFNISAEAMGNMALMARQSGGDMQSALEETAVQVTVLSKKFGVSGKAIGKNLSELTADMGSFGHMSQAELTATATYAAKLGVEIGTLKGMFDKFANFEDAATGAAKLAETFGMNVDAMELMNAESPAEQMDMMRKAFLETGRSLDDLSRQEKAYLAEQMGVDPNDLYGMFDPANADLSFDEITEEAEAAAEKMSPEDAMKEAAKSIEKSIQSAMEKVEGFIDAFVKGFAYALKFTEPFMKATQSIRNALREVFKIGGELARELFGKGGAFHSESMHGVSLLQKVLGSRNDPKSVVGIFVILKDSILALAKGEITFNGLITRMKDALTDFVRSDHFQELGSVLLNGLTTAIGFVLSSLTGLVESLATGISEEFSGMDVFGDASSPINKSLAKMFETISQEGGPLMDALGTLANKALSAIADFLMSNPKVLFYAFAFMFGPAIAGAIVSALVPVLASAAATAIGGLFATGGAFGVGGTFATAMAASGGSILAGLSAVFAPAIAFITTILLPLIKFALVLYGAVKSVTQIFSNLTRRFEESGSVAELIIGYFTEIAFLPSRIAANIIDLIAGFFGFETNVVGAIDNVVDFLVNDFLGFFTSLPDKIVAVFDTVMNFLGGLGTTFANAFSGAFNAVVDFVANVGTSIFGIVKSVGSTILEVTKYFNPIYWGSLAMDAVSGFFKNFSLGGMVDKAKGALKGVLGIFGIASDSKEMIKVGEDIVGGLETGTAGMENTLKGPSQKNIDKIAKEMDKLDTSKISQATEKFMDLETVAESLNNVMSALKELETGVAAKKLATAATDLPVALKSLMDMGNAVVKFGVEQGGPETISALNRELHFYADRIPQVSGKIKAIADAINEMGVALSELTSKGAGAPTADVIKTLQAIFGKDASDETALVPALSGALNEIGQERLSQLNGSEGLAFYVGRFKQVAAKTTSLAESMTQMMDAMDEVGQVIPGRADAVGQNIEAVIAKITEVNGAIAGIDSVEAVTKLQAVANGLASDGTVTVQYEQMQLNVNFTVQIDSADLANSIGEGAKDGSYFVINQDRSGGGASQAEQAGG